MRQSSANSRVWDEVTHWGKSFKYTRNNNGPRTVPWGMPDVTGLVSDKLPSRTTVWSRWERLPLHTVCDVYFPDSTTPVAQLWAAVGPPLAANVILASEPTLAQQWHTTVGPPLAQQWHVACELGHRWANISATVGPMNNSDKCSTVFKTLFTNSSQNTNKKLS